MNCINCNNTVNNNYCLCVQCKKPHCPSCAQKKQYVCDNCGGDIVYLP